MTDLEEDTVTMTTNAVTVSWVQNTDIEKVFSLNRLGTLGPDWFVDNFSSEISKDSVTSISFQNEEPVVGTLVKEDKGLSYYKSGTNLYVVGRKIVFDSSSSLMFMGFSSVSQIDLSIVDTSNVVSMANMFDGCASLTNLDLSGFVTSNVTAMYGMFSDV